MRKLQILASAFSAMALGAAMPTHANLLPNGSFEDIAGTWVEDSTAHGMMKLEWPSLDVLPGWRVRWPGRNVAWVRDANPYGASASDGSFHIDLTGTLDGPSFNGVVTAFDSVPGARYRLSFDLGVNNGPCGGVPCSGPVGVLLDVVGVLSQRFMDFAPGGAGQQWTTLQVDFTAVDTRTVLAFDGQQGQAYIGLDNVTVTAVPEAATWALFGAGLGALAWRRRRATGR